MGHTIWTASDIVECKDPDLSKIIQAIAEPDTSASVSFKVWVSRAVLFQVSDSDLICITNPNKNREASIAIPDDL